MAREESARSWQKAEEARLSKERGRRKQAAAIAQMRKNAQAEIADLRQQAADWEGKFRAPAAEAEATRPPTH